jgi:hypothetical protein
MGALTQIYVDPSLDSDSGAGTSGDPYGDLQWALNVVGRRDTANGTQINIKAGASPEVLTAPLNWTEWGATSTSNAPTVLRGYNDTANDGGRAVIDGGGGAISSAAAFTHWIDLELRNGGSSTILDVGATCRIANCRIHNTSGIGVNLATNCLVTGCEIFDCGEGVVAAAANGFIEYNYFRYGTIRNFTTATRNVQSGPVRWHRNIISMGTTGNAITIANPGGQCVCNSILAAASTGHGISTSGTSKLQSAIIVNNVIEGFNGEGGRGFDWANETRTPLMYAGNAAFGNATNYANVGDMGVFENVDNEVLTASPFAKTGDDTFANRFAYFSPTTEGNIRGGAIQ